MRMEMKPGLKMKQAQAQRLRLRQQQLQTPTPTTQTGGAFSLDLDAKGRVRRPDVGKVEGAETEETEPLPKVDVISGSLARWKVGKFKTPAGPKAREQFKTKSPLKGFRSVEERKAGGFSVFDTKEVNFY
jgi:hypothetical protein